MFKLTAQHYVLVELVLVDGAILVANLAILQLVPPAFFRIS